MASTIEFVIPQHKEDLGLTRDGVFCVQKAVEVHRLKPAKVAALIDAATERVHRNPLAITEESNVFDLFYSVLSTYNEVTGDTRERTAVALGQILEEITAHIESQLNSESPLRPELRASKSSLSGIVFLVQWFVSMAESEELGSSGTNKKKGNNGWDWSKSKNMVISPLIAALKLDLGRLWGLDCPSDDFVSLLTSMAYNLLENPANVRSKAMRDAIFTVVEELVIRYGHAAGASSKVMHLLTKHEHLSSALAVLMNFISKRGPEGVSVVIDVFKEIGEIDSRALASDSASARYMSLFLGECASEVPSIMLSNLSIILVHLDGENHSLRSGVVSVCGRLLSQLSVIAEAKKEEEEEDDHLSSIRDDLLQIVQDRMQDVSAFVRAKALQTWVSLFTDRAVPLKTTPIAASLCVNRLYDKAALVRRAALLALNTALQYNPYGAALPLSQFRARLDEVDKKLEDEENAGNEKMQFQSRFLTDAVAFISAIESAIPAVSDLLGSKTLTDVTEAIQFFITARQFSIKSAPEGLRKMLHLVWSRDLQISEAAEGAVRRLYLSPPDIQGDKHQIARANAVHVAKNLVILTRDANLAELTSLSELIGRLTSGDKTGLKLPTDCPDALWAIFTGKLVVEPGKEKVDQRGALTVIGMIAGTDPASLSRRLDILSDHALAADNETVRLACVALGKIWTDSKKHAVTEARLSATHPLVQKLVACIVRDEGHDTWFTMAEEALNTLFHMAEAPSSIAASIVKTVAAPLLTPSTDMTSWQLSRILFIVGHIALRQLVYIEECEAAHARQRSKAEKKDRSSLEEAVGGSGGGTDDADAEYVAAIEETDIVRANLLGMFGPVIVKVCEGIGGRFKDITLAATAALSLCKFMATSAVFCRDNLRLFITMIGSSPPLVRANLAIGLGDLAFRHPNLIEPYTEHIYARLRDGDVRVRRHTLMVLTHLILNDMIKVKGQIFEMAARMVDQDSRIADLARLFFQELAAKGNTLYNLLPDIISQLSTGPDDFREILRYLLTFIKKERQLDSLIDKLCRRFATTLDVIQWQNLAFCLVQLPINDKGIKKINELFSFFGASLYDDEVYDHFKTILARTRKLIRVEQRQTVDDLEIRLDAAHAKSAEDHAVDEGASRVTKKAVAKYGEKVAREREAELERAAEMELERAAAEHKSPSPVRGRVRGRGRGRGGGGRRKLVVEEEESSESDVELLDVSDSDESNESSSEEEEVVEVKRGRGRGRGRGRRR